LEQEQENQNIEKKELEDENQNLRNRLLEIQQLKDKISQLNFEASENEQQYLNLKNGQDKLKQQLQQAQDKIEDLQKKTNLN